MRDMDVALLGELEKILPDEEPVQDTTEIEEPVQDTREIEEPIKRRTKK